MKVAHIIKCVLNSGHMIQTEEEHDVCIRLHSCSSQCYALVPFAGFVSIWGISSFEELCVISALKAYSGLSNKGGSMPLEKSLWSIRGDWKGRDEVV